MRSSLAPARLARFGATRPFDYLTETFKQRTRSATWYDNLAEHLKLPSCEFAMNYIGRSGPIDTERLRAMSPRFVAGYEAWRKAA